MTHELYDVTDFQIVGDYKIRVIFDDGSMQLIDFQPVLYGKMYGPLRDRSRSRRWSAWAEPLDCSRTTSRSPSTPAGARSGTAHCRRWRCLCLRKRQNPVSFHLA